MRGSYDKLSSASRTEESRGLIASIALTVKRKHMFSDVDGKLGETERAGQNVCAIRKQRETVSAKLNRSEDGTETVQAKPPVML